MLISLTLSNWRSHALTKIEFAHGTNLFLGQMGAGKSSAVDALCFALYGTYPKIQRRDVSVEDVANFRHPGQQVAVELEWKNWEGEQNEIYKVRRELGKKTEAWLWKGGKLLQKGAKAVTAQIEHEIGIDYELFARAVYSEQNRMDYWLSLPPSSRKAELDRLLGLDAFERAKEGCASEASGVRALAEAAEALAKPEMIAAARVKLAEAGKAEEEAKKENASAHAELEAKGAEAKKAADAFAVVEAKRKRHFELAGKAAALDGKIEALAAQAKGAGELKEAEVAAQLSSAKNERVAAEGALGEIEKKERDARGEEGKLAGAKKAADERRKKRDELNAQIAKLLAGREAGALAAAKEKCAAERKEAVAKLASCEAEQKALASAEKALLDSKGASCPVCGGALDDEHKRRIAGEKKEAAARLAAERVAFASMLRAADAAVAKADSDAAMLERLNAQLGALADDSKEDYAARLAALASEIAKMREAAIAQKKLCDTARAKENDASLKMQKVNDAKKAEATLVAAREERAKAAGEIAAIGFDEAAWKGASDANSSAQKAHAAAQERVKSLLRILAQAGQIREGAARELAGAEAKIAEAKALRARLDELASFRGVVVATQAEVRALLLDELNSALSKLWPMLYPYGDWKGVRILGGEKDYAFEVWQGEWKPLESFASGGERASVALAVRVAMSLMLTPHLGWIVLDEPTHNLDSQAVVSLGGALATQLPKIIPQAVVITHDAALVESTPSRVHRFERDKAGAEDSRVSAE